jgi:hypothetical protein
VTAYYVYEPASEAPNVSARADRLDFVKDGISWPALIVPAFWLLYHRMWIELLVYVVAYGVLGWAMSYAQNGADFLAWIGIALSVLFALEANDLRRYALERKGYRQLGVAIGGSREAAELAFFRAWLPEQSNSTRAPERPAKRKTTAGTAPAEAEEVIGLFPRP